MDSIIIPVYNEEARVTETAERVCAFFDMLGEKYELLFVNDGSHDGTAQKIAELNLPRVRDVGYPINRGKGYALRRGAREAAGERLVFMDADLAYGLELIPEALGELKAADVVIGSRPLAKEAYASYPLLRKVTSEGFRTMVHLTLGLPFHDTQCGFKCWKKRAADAVFPRCGVDGFAIDLEALAWAERLGFKVKEIPAVIQVHGDSKVRVVHDSIQMMRDTLRVRRALKRGEATDEKREDS